MSDQKIIVSFYNADRSFAYENIEFANHAEAETYASEAAEDWGTDVEGYVRDEKGVEQRILTAVFGGDVWDGEDTP